MSSAVLSHEFIPSKFEFVEEDGGNTQLGAKDYYVLLPSLYCLTHELSDRLTGEEANRDDAGFDRGTVCCQLVPVLHCTTLSARRPRSSEQLLGSHYNRYTPAPRLQVNHHHLVQNTSLSTHFARF